MQCMTQGRPDTVAIYAFSRTARNDIWSATVRTACVDQKRCSTKKQLQLLFDGTLGENGHYNYANIFFFVFFSCFMISSSNAQGGQFSRFICATINRKKMEKDETSFDDFCCNMRDSAAQKQFRKDGNDGETEAS